MSLIRPSLRVLLIAALAVTSASAAPPFEAAEPSARRPAPSTYDPHNNGSSPRNLHALAGGPHGSQRALFSAAVDLERCLWTSDGTVAGTFRLTVDGECVPVRPEASPVVEVVEGIGYVVAGLNPYRLWRTDGTDDGTWPLTTATDAGLWRLRDEVHVSPALRRVFFVGDDGTHGAEPWVSDGSPGSARLLADLEPGAAGSRPQGFQEVGGSVLFFREQAGRWELWRTDGTSDGTARLATPRPGRLNIPPGRMHPVAGGAVFFLQTAVPCRRELWVTDATAGGTRLLASHRPEHCPDADRPQVLTLEGIPGTVFFVADDGTHGLELWRTDGSPAGTYALTDLGPEEHLVEASPTGRPALALDGRIFFAVESPGHGIELWASDGSPADARLAVDLCPGPCSSRPDLFTVLDGRLFLSAYDDRFGVHEWHIGRELWLSDGTEAGTERMTDVEGLFDVRSTPVRFGDRAFFIGDDGPDSGLWRFDREDGAVFLTRGVEFSGLVSRQLPVAMLDGVMLLVGRFGAGLEPWVSDGTPAGTRLLADLQPPVPGPFPEEPDNVQVEYLDRRHVRLTWEDTTDDEDGFVIQSRQIGDWDVSFHLVVPPNTTSWVFELDPGHHYFEVDGLRNGKISTIYGAGEPVDMPGCVESEAFLCLGDGHFRVSASWRNQHAPPGAIASGAAIALPPIPGADDTGTLAFFDPDNAELLVKVLDGSAVNEYVWVLHGGLTDLEHRIVVEDLRFFEAEVRRRVYHQPAGELCGGADTTAFFGDWWVDPAEEPEEFPFARTLPIGTHVAGPLAGSGNFAVAHGPATRFVAIDAAAPTSARVSAPSSPAGSCVPDGETLCLLDGRLAVRVEWTDQHNGGTGVGRALPSTDLTGYFWFFAPENLELAVKALDGSSVNGARRPAPRPTSA
jgi:ELWxxDGT repeat protein